MEDYGFVWFCIGTLLFFSVLLHGVLPQYSQPEPAVFKKLEKSLHYQIDIYLLASK